MRRYTWADVERVFWARVDKSGDCWLWTGPLNNKGYGQMSVPRWTGRRHYYAHRYSWELVHGPIPPDRAIDHRCHTPRCVKPDHLRPVTGTQNQENRKGASTNSQTGYRNVYPAPIEGRYIVQVGRKHIGTFYTLADAVEASIQARLRTMTHNDNDRKALAGTALFGPTCPCGHSPHGWPCPGMIETGKGRDSHPVPCPCVKGKICAD